MCPRDALPRVALRATPRPRNFQPLRATPGAPPFDVTDYFRDRLAAALAATYRIDDELVGAGMSRVFAATEHALGRKVVIKVLPPELSAGVNRERFQREIQVAAQLQHPHVVPLLSAGRCARSSGSCTTSSKRSPMRTAAALCIATSSRETSSRSARTPSSPTSAWPKRSAPRCLCRG